MIQLFVTSERKKFVNKEEALAIYSSTCTGEIKYSYLVSPTISY